MNQLEVWAWADPCPCGTCSAFSISVHCLAPPPPPPAPSDTAIRHSRTAAENVLSWSREDLDGGPREWSDGAMVVLVAEVEIKLLFVVCFFPSLFELCCFFPPASVHNRTGGGFGGWGKGGRGEAEMGSVQNRNPTRTGQKLFMAGQVN